MTINKENNNNFKKIGVIDKEIVKSTYISLIYEFPTIIYRIIYDDRPTVLSKEDIKELEELAKFLTI